MPTPKKTSTTTDRDDTDDDATDDTLALIQFRGHTFSIPKDMDEWETEACIAMGQKSYVIAAKLLLGDGQWALLQSLGSKRKDIREFLTVFGEAIARDCVE